MLRKFFILPPFLFFAIAFSNLFSGQPDAFFYFIMWFVIGLFLAIALWPIAKKSTEENTAIMQVFAVLIFSFIFWAVATYFDLVGAEVSPAEAFGYCIALGIGVTAFIMMLKGE